MNSQDIAKTAKELLIAEKSDYFDPAMVSAINMAVNHVFMAINMGLGRRKFGEEFFRDVMICDVFRTSQNSRIKVGSFSQLIWSIVGVEVAPETGSTGLQIPNQADDTLSYLRPDLFVTESGNSAGRLTIEEWSVARKDPFADGYSGEGLCVGLQEYAYLNPIQYRESQVIYGPEVHIRPLVSRGIVAVFYAAQPSAITELGNNDLMMPGSLFNVIVAKTIEYLRNRINGDINSTVNDLSLLFNSN